MFHGESMSERKLKEVLGHSPLQVMAGAVLGVFVAVLYAYQYGSGYAALSLNIYSTYYFFNWTSIVDFISVDSGFTLDGERSERLANTLLGAKDGGHHHQERASA